GKQSVRRVNMTAYINQTQPKPTTHESHPGWLTQAWLEPRFVVVTLVAILLSIAAERADAPQIIIALLGVIAYIAGGTFGLIGALESLRERKLDVDMLMILAALGAAVVGEWRDG